MIEVAANVEILKLLLAKGEVTNLRKLQREIIGESCYWRREGFLRLVLEDFPSVRFHWRGGQTQLMSPSLAGTRPSFKYFWRMKSAKAKRCDCSHSFAA